MTLDLVKSSRSRELRKLTRSAFLHAGLALGFVRIVCERNPDRQRPCLKAAQKR
jgi:hypothetical protein